MQATEAPAHEQKRPMTGAQYLESLRDGREIWLNGERVQDVTTHLAFRNGARSVARLYDALHDPEQQDVLTGATPNGALTHKSFLLACTPQVYPRLKELIQLVAAGGLIQIPSSAKDFANPELRPFLDLYYKGAGIDAEQRVKLSKLAWDAIGSEFGGRHELYERNYAGNIESIKVETFLAAQAAGDRAYLERLVQNCLYDYDLTGWTGPTWCGPAD